MQMAHMEEAREASQGGGGAPQQRLCTHDEHLVEVRLAQPSPWLHRTERSSRKPVTAIYSPPMMSATPGRCGDIRYKQDAPKFFARSESWLSEAATECACDSPIPSSDADEVYQNTLLNRKRSREAEAEVDIAELARKAQRRQRDTRVRFGTAVSVRIVDEDEQRHESGACAQHHEAGGVCDHEVETKLVDGPNLISQVVSSLFVCIAQRRLKNVEGIMWTLHTTLVNSGWTSITSQLELDLLAQVYCKIEALESALVENGVVSILPGAMRLTMPVLPLMQQLKLGIHKAALRIVREREERERASREREKELFLSRSLPHAHSLDKVPALQVFVPMHAALNSFQCVTNLSRSKFAT
jgi:hypothetical protein